MEGLLLLVVGWDGACFELTRRFGAGGAMPVLAGLLAGGRAWQVESTVPAVTFPAWTSFLTGSPPDHHGVTDFAIPRDGEYGVRFVNSTHRVLPTIVAAMAEAGLRVGMYGLPATYPAEGKGIFEICGFDTPLGASGAGRGAHPRALADELRRRYGRLGVEGLPQSRIDAGWHRRSRLRLLEDIELRTRIACDLVREQRPDVFLVHFMESDTVSHHYWHFDDETSPRHRSGHESVLGDVYRALDRSLGELIREAGSDADVVLLSDHGSAGASDRVLFWNRCLADLGWLEFQEGRREPLASSAKRAALALLPPGLQARAFAMAGVLADRMESGARFSGIDWKRTRVYSDEVPYFPSLRLNLAGREREGLVGEHEREGVIESLTRDLLALRDPFDAGPVVETVTRREEMFDGPFVHRYPDLFLGLRRPGGYAYGAGASRGGREKAWIRRLNAAEASGAKGSATSGVHSAFGMAVACGPSVEMPSREDGELPSCTLADLGVTVLALAGVARSKGMLGRSLVGADAEDGSPLALPVGAPAEYSEAEESQVAERLRALGYLP